MSSDTTATGWTYTTLGFQRIPVHCARQAFDLDMGEWECAHCEAVVHVRAIPGWVVPVPPGMTPGRMPGRPSTIV